VKPRDGSLLAAESGLAEDRIVAALVEMHHDAVRLDFDSARRLHEAPVHLLRRSFLIAPQPAGQPALAAVGDDGQRRVQVDVQPHLAGEAIEVEEIDADSQAVFHAIASGVADDQSARRLL